MTDISNSEKLQKVLARAGAGSRRDMERLIAEGRVTVNGQVALLGDRVEPDARIAIDGKPLVVKSADELRKRVLIYNKPEGEICSARDPEGRPTVFDRLPHLKGERWICVGRLDFNTSGLLLFTNDGELANGLMHPSSNIDREYLCRVLGDVDDQVLERLKEGVLLDDGMARFTDITDGGGSGANHWYYVCLTEGRNREVRRLWESQEVMVSRLKRVRFGQIFLPSRLKQGQWQELTPQELQVVYQMAGLQPPPVRSLAPEERAKVERQHRKRPAPQPPGARSQRSAAPQRKSERSPTGRSATRRGPTDRGPTERRTVRRRDR
ncbi:MAG: 23S rRNA pseudouridine(2605) synthase RluB [Spongiibacteraceae bacterium]|jgi:23S rRNA pseudouridine2605 synthase|nr:23S rRNA pseudouridine(2605) synthase RluB [Spongiibacteraceae bacterium]